MRYATIVPQYVIDRLLTTDLDVNFLMNANKMRYKSRFLLFPMLMLLDKDASAIFFSSMMQISHAGVRMQSLSMMVPAHIFNCDANVSLQG